MPVFHIEMRGQGVLPQTTSVKDLADFLVNFETTVLETAKVHEIEWSAEDIVLSLVDIEEGSNRLALSIIPALTIAVSIITQSISTSDYSRLPVKAHQSLYSLYQQAAKRNWEVAIVGDEDFPLESTSISVENPVPNPFPEYVRGTTTVFGRCIKAGGAEPKVDVRIANRRRLLHVETSEGIAKQLARNLYENVAITGEAWWDPETWEIVRLKAQSVTNFQSGSALQSFKELAEVSGDRWEGIDATSYVDEIRAAREGE